MLHIYILTDHNCCCTEPFILHICVRLYHKLSSSSADCGQGGVQGSLVRASGTSCQLRWSSTPLLRHWYTTCTAELYYEEGTPLIVLGVILMALSCRLVLLHG